MNLEKVIEIVLEAGKAVMDIYEREFNIELKRRHKPYYGGR